MLARVGALWRVPDPLSPSEAALKWRVLENRGGGYSGPWRFEPPAHPAQFLRRPMDCLAADSPYWMVAVQGPSQCGKSEIGNNWLLHTVMVEPGDMIFMGLDTQSVRDYVIKEINKMIRNCPDMAAHLLPTAGANNIHSKEFDTCNFFAVHPVGTQVRGKPCPKIRIDDYDGLPEDLNGEGNAVMALSGRQTAFSETKFYVNSSPALGPKRGIEALVGRGTQERWWVPCRHCGQFFVLDHESFHFNADSTPEKAAETACVICPHCEGDHVQAHKPALMAGGDWVGEGQSIGGDGEFLGELRQSEIASFYFTGEMGFAPFSRHAFLRRSAEIAWERAQDEAELRAYFQGREGINYKSRLADADPISLEDLMARVRDSDYAQGTVPEGAVCLTAAVDVGRKFDVMVCAWKPDFECYVVDRFEIVALDESTAIEPMRKPEHWGVLIKLVLWRRWPLSGEPELSMPLLNVAIDTGGAEATTEHAYRFYYHALGLGIPRTALTLVKGSPDRKARLLPPPSTDIKRKARKDDPDLELWRPNVNRFKDIIDTRLRRREPGPSYLGFPRDFSEEHLAELTAEEKDEAGNWQRLEHRRNETLDLLVYNTAAIWRLGSSDGSLNWVPEWARPAREPVH